MAETAIYPGTFDTITFGHIDVIKKSLNIVDELIVATTDNIEKDYLFSLENRNSYYSFNYRGELSDSWAMQLGGSYSENIDYSDVSLPGDLFPLISPTDTTYIDTTLFIDEGSYDDLLQFRSVFIKNIFSNSKVKFGLHFFDRKNKFLQFQIDETAYGIDRYNEYNRELDEFLSAGFLSEAVSLPFSSFLAG